MHLVVVARHTTFNVLAGGATTHVFFDITGYFMKVDKSQYRTFTTTAYGTGTHSLTTTCANMQTMTVDAPGPGQVVVRANVLTYVGHYDADSHVTLALSNTSTSDCSKGGFTGVGVESSWPTGSYMFTPSGERVFTVAAAGTYSFYLNARRSTYSTSGYVFETMMSATFQPQ